MNKTKIILIGSVAAILTSAAVVFIPIEINNKIASLTAQTIANNKKNENSIALQEENMHQALMEIADVKNQLSNITYKPGFVAQLSVPKSTEQDIEAIEKSLNTPEEWNGHIKYADKLNQSFSDVVKTMPSWQIDELQPRLYAIRWAIDSLAIVNLSEATSLDGMADQLEKVEQQIKNEPEGAYVDLSGLMQKKYNQLLLDGKKLSINNAKSLLQSGSQDQELLNSSLSYLKEFSKEPIDADDVNLEIAVSSAIDVATVTARIKELSDNLSGIEKTNQNDLIQTAAIQADQSFTDLRLFAFQKNLLSNSTLSPEFEKLKNLIGSIKDKIKNDNIKTEDGKIKNYQIWALTQIKSVRSLDEILDQNYKLINGVVERNNPLSEANKKAKETSQDELLSEMVEYLSPINQNILDNAVSQWYQIIFQKRFSELDEGHQLKLVESFAIANKKGLE